MTKVRGFTGASKTDAGPKNGFENQSFSAACEISFPFFTRHVRHSAALYCITALPCACVARRFAQAATIARVPEMKVHRLFPTNLTPARRKPGMSTLKNWVALWLVACA